MWPWGGGAPEVDIGDNVPNSLMLDSTASQYCTLLLASGALKVKGTIAVLIKRGKIGGLQNIINVGNTATTWAGIYINANGQLCFSRYSGGAYQCNLITSAVFSDPGTWFHVTVSWDSSASVSSDRATIEVNGIVAGLSTAVYPSLNLDMYMLNGDGTTYHSIGRYPTSGNYYDGYLANLIAVPDQKLSAADFGRTSADTGAWVNKTYTGTYGANGFKLEFLNGASLGTDTSGNGNNWTLNGGITSANQYTDTPTNNYCVWNWLNGNHDFIWKRGNLVTNVPNTRAAAASLAMVSGNWSAEITVGAVPAIVGVAKPQVNAIPAAVGQFTDIDSFGYVSTGNKIVSGSSSAYGSAYVAGDIITIKYAAATRTLEFKKNNVSQGAFVISGTSPMVYLVYGGTGTADPTYFTLNCGQNQLMYPVDVGYLGLCTSNLPQPSIIKPAKYFKAQKRTGTGAAANITGIEFSPDLVWTKSRSAATSHVLANSVVGSTKYLSSDSTAAEVTDAQSVTAFNADGFSVGTAAILNTNTATYIDWMLKRGVVPGIDVVTFTAPASGNFTVAHSLGVVPAMVIAKCRGAVSEWSVYNKNLTAPATYRLALNTTAAQATVANSWLNTDSSNLGLLVGTTAVASQTGEAILFSEVDGFSKMGSYVGNAAADGVFVYCGFRPALIMTKCITTTGDWRIYDTARPGYNVQGGTLLANSAAAETTAAELDILSNGFKLRITTDPNAAQTYIFMAFAENSIKYSNAR